MVLLILVSEIVWSMYKKNIVVFPNDPLDFYFIIEPFDWALTINGLRGRVQVGPTILVLIVFYLFNSTLLIRKSDGDVNPSQFHNQKKLFNCIPKQPAGNNYFSISTFRTILSEMQRFFLQRVQSSPH